MHVKKPSKERLISISSAIFGLITALILVFALLAMGETTKESGNVNIYLFFLFLSLAASRGYLAAYTFQERKAICLPFIKNLVYVAIFIVGSALSLFLPLGPTLVTLVTVVYFGAVIMNRICLMIEKRTIGSYIVNPLLSILALLAILVVLVLQQADDAAADTLLFLLLIVILMSLFDVLGFVFSKIHLRGLLKIIRKTYVIEILYGLIILMVSCSFYFSIMESGIASFWDGLWYSFAIITTIGLGDLTVTSGISRALTAVLGIYGIIVTASITSVIVNYYNEVKSEKPEEEPKGEEHVDEETPKE